jgi:hypothetical protein
LGANILEDEAGKVDFFITQCGVRSELLPRSYAGRLMYFPDRFPILVSDTGIPRFTFFDEGQVTTTRFDHYLTQYKPLFAALGEFELLYVSDSESNSARAKAAFHRFLPADRLHGITSLTPMGVEHFLEYLDASQRYDTKGGVTSARDLEVLREGERLYDSLEHRALQAAWNNGSTGADRIRQRVLQSSMRVSFSTMVLPYRYPLDLALSEHSADEGDDTHHHTHDDTPFIGDKS